MRISAGQAAETNAKEKSPKNEIPKAKTRWPRILSLAVPFLIGVVVGGSLAYLWFEVYQDYSARVTEVRKQLETANEQNKTLEDQLEEAELKLNNVQIGFGRMNKLFNQMKQPPDKPRFAKTKDGLIVFWLDGMLWRRYHLYQGKGRRGELKKVNKRSTQINFKYLPELKAGTYRFGVAALDREGQETDMSKILEIKYKP